MKLKTITLLIAALALTTVAAEAQMLISDFFNIGTQAFTPFNSNWNNGSADQFVQNSGYISITSVSTGDPRGDGSFDALIAGSSDFSGITTLSLTASVDGGNASSLVKIIVSDSLFTTIGFADFNTSSLNSSFSTVNASFTLLGGGTVTDATYWTLTGDGIAANSFRMSFDHLQANTIPEPSTYVLLALGLGGLALLRRWHKSS